MTEKKRIQDFALTRVVTRDVLTDAFQSLRNFFGMRLRGYEKRVQETIDSLLEEMRLRYDVFWYRLEVNPLTQGSVIIVVYGEGRENE